MTPVSGLAGRWSPLKRKTGAFGCDLDAALLLQPACGTVAASDAQHRAGDGDGSARRLPPGSDRTAHAAPCLHNNAAERRMRPLALVRKNYRIAGGRQAGRDHLHPGWHSGAERLGSADVSTRAPRLHRRPPNQPHQRTRTQEPAARHHLSRANPLQPQPSGDAYLRLAAAPGEGPGAAGRGVTPPSPLWAARRGMPVAAARLTRTRHVRCGRNGSPDGAIERWRPRRPASTNSRWQPETFVPRFPPLLQSVFENTFSVVSPPRRSATFRHVFRAHLGTSSAIPSRGARLSPGFSLRTLGLARSSLQAPTLCFA